MVLRLAESLAAAGSEQATEAFGVRIFAGQRLDPFFLDLAAESAETRAHLATRRVSLILQRLEAGQ